MCVSCGRRLFGRSQPLERRPVIDVPSEPVALARPRLGVAEFLRRIADDLEAKRATMAGRDERFERIRIKSDQYDIYLARYDPDRHRM